MTTKWMTQTTALAAVALATVTAGCGEFVREQGRAPAQVVVLRMEAAAGATPDDTEGTLRSDVITLVSAPAPCTAQNPCQTVFNDFGIVSMSLIMKDPGTPVVAAPTQLNFVTFNRYRVSYQRTDGRNTSGVDVPYPFDSAVTFTVTNDVTAANFQLVRHSAKEEAPLRALATSNAIISTIAQVTFYGRDQAGNEVTVTGNISVDFGNFADPR